MTDLITEIKQKLIADYGFKPPKDGGKYLIQGKCPNCGQKKVYVNAEKPFYLVCNRRNECRYEANIKDVYPELFEDWSKRFPPTPLGPNETADNYLRIDRGLDIKSIKGAYSQEVFKDYASGQSSATVRFTLACGASWERIIDKTHRFDRKANFKGDYRGFWWHLPNCTIETLSKATEIWICEGIFDAVALNQAGKVAVSAMTSNNYPRAELQKIIKYLADNEIAARPTLVFAYDLGKAGENAIKSQIEYAKADGWNAIGALPTNFDGKFPDWNDLYKSERLTSDDFEHYIWNGAVLCAKDHKEKAKLLLEKTDAQTFYFCFKHHTYWARVDQKQFEKLTGDGLTEKSARKHALAISEIATCEFKFLYFQRDHVIDETNYYLRVTNVLGQEITATFSGSAISGAGDFKKRLLAVCAGAQFTGKTEQLERIVRDDTRFIKTITTIDFTGYSPDHKTYLLGDLAIRAGRITKANKDKYFDFGKDQLKLRAEKSPLAINYPDGIKTDWIYDFYNAFREKGVVVLAYFIASLFAEQIRAKHSSFLFLEINGIGGSGKSTLLQFLWKMMGRDGYEGINPNKGSFAGVARNMAKFSNLPVVLLEGDTKNDMGHQKRFDFDILKDAYNGLAIYTRGVRNQGTETYEPPFRGAIVIEQNEMVQASDPTMERIANLRIDKEPWWSNETHTSAVKIETWDCNEISGFIAHFIKAEDTFLTTFFEAQPRFETRFLNRDVRVNNQRIRKCHGQLHAAIDAAFGGKNPLLSLKPDWIKAAHECVDRMAIDRDRLFMSDPPELADFWDQIEFLEGFVKGGMLELAEQKDLPINLHREPETYFALNIPHYEAFCRVHNQNPKMMDTLRRQFRNSKSRKFIDNKVLRCIDNKSRNCWIFYKPGKEPKK